MKKVKSIIYLVALMLMLVPFTRAQGYYPPSTGEVECPWCVGVGEYSIGIGRVDCSHCAGTGRYRYNRPSLKIPSPKDYKVQRICPVCEGCKRVPAGWPAGSADFCPRCDGQGYIEERNSQYRPVVSRMTKVYRYNNGNDNLSELLMELTPDERLELEYVFVASKTLAGEDFWSRWDGMTAEQILEDYERIKGYLHATYRPVR